jgi:hypothetical protein
MIDLERKDYKEEEGGEVLVDLQVLMIFLKIYFRGWDRCRILFSLIGVDVPTDNRPLLPII